MARNANHRSRAEPTSRPVPRRTLCRVLFCLRRPSPRLVVAAASSAGGKSPALKCPSGILLGHKQNPPRPPRPSPPPPLLCVCVCAPLSSRPTNLFPFPLSHSIHRLLDPSTDSPYPASCSVVLGSKGWSIDGEGAVLRQEGAQEGAVDAGGGQVPRRLHPGQRPRQLAPAPQARRAEPVREELPAAVDELPAAGHQTWALHPRRAEVHRPAPRHRRQQVVHDRGAAARPDGQRDQELLEHAPQEAAAPDGPRRAPAWPGRRLPRRAPHGAVGDRAPRGRGAPLPPLLRRLRDGHHHNRLRLVVLHRGPRRRRGRARDARRRLPAPVELRHRELLPQGGRGGRVVAAGGRQEGRGEAGGGASRGRLLGGVQRDGGGRSGGGRVPDVPRLRRRGAGAVPRPARRLLAVPADRRAGRGVTGHGVQVRRLATYVGSS